MLTTRFTRLVGCTVPIQQAGMGAIANANLAAAVAEAGGQGMVSWNGMPAAKLTEILGEVRGKTQGVFGANFLIPGYTEEDADEIGAAVDAAASQARVIDFFYNDPVPYLIEAAHKQGALACWQIGSRQEALAAVDAGCDFIIAQGIEAGGHIRGRLGLMALLNEVLEAVDVPVLAAGGIGSARNLAAVLAAGADGARVGTRFVAAQESGAHPQYVEALIEAEAGDTVVGETFSYGWPDAPHRALRACVEAANAFNGEIVGERFSLYKQGRAPVHRFEAVGVMADTTGAIEAMSQWAGESVGGVRSQQTAAEIVEELSGGAEALLRSSVSACS